MLMFLWMFMFQVYIQSYINVTKNTDAAFVLWLWFWCDPLKICGYSIPDVGGLGGGYG